MRGQANIVVGAIFIFCGLTGRLALIGTHSGKALAVLGAVLVVLGVMRMARANS
jgi:hypothetical protein